MSAAAHSQSRAELRMVAIYAALLSTLCVVLMNALVIRHSGTHSALFGTSLDRALQSVSAVWIAAIFAAPIAFVCLRLLMRTRIIGALVAAMFTSTAAFCVFMLVFMLQD